MKIHNIVIGKEKVIQIFVGREEVEYEEIKTKIQELRNTNDRVVVFVAGQNEIMASMKEILQLVAVNG